MDNEEFFASLEDRIVNGEKQRGKDDVLKVSWKWQTFIW